MERFEYEARVLDMVLGACMGGGEKMEKTERLERHPLEIFQLGREGKEGSTEWEFQKARALLWAAPKQNRMLTDLAAHLRYAVTTGEMPSRSEMTAWLNEVERTLAEATVTGGLAHGGLTL